MRIKQLSQTSMTIALVLSYCLATIPVQAATPVVTKSKPSRKIRWKPPTPPNDLGIPGNRGQGGGQRGGCKQYADVTALVPRNPQGIYWGQTMRDRPTVWLNTPQGLSADLLMEIAVRDENGQPIAKQLLTTPLTPAGVISVPFPATATLAENHTYHWEVSFYCDQDVPDKPFIVQGQIQRVAPQPLPIDPLEQAQLLAERGIWFDALTLLGDAHRASKTENLAIGWDELLQSAAINIDHDIINSCCQLNPPPVH
jgi:Domain of Unknown Function (DUF928)